MCDRKARGERRQATLISPLLLLLLLCLVHRAERAEWPEYLRGLSRTSGPLEGSVDIAFPMRRALTHDVVVRALWPDVLVLAPGGHPERSAEEKTRPDKMCKGLVRSSYPEAAKANEARACATSIVITVER